MTVIQEHDYSDEDGYDHITVIRLLNHRNPH